jgi:hypothetical protein
VLLCQHVRGAYFAASGGCASARWGRPRGQRFPAGGRELSEWGVGDRPDAAQITARLGTALTDAITRVVGDDLRVGTMVELVASPPERTFVDGVLTV